MPRPKTLVSVLAATVALAQSLASCGGADSDRGDSLDAGITCRNYTSSQTIAPLWEQLSPSGSVPQVRYGASSAYDAARDTLIVFGGTDLTTSYNDVRVLTNASGANGAPAWTSRQVSGTPPSPRYHALGAYSSAQDALFIFGGVDGSGKIQADLWKLASASGAGGTSTWSSVPIAGTAPTPVRGQMGGIYAAESDTLLFFGGINCGTSSCTEYSDTWAIRGLGTGPTWSAVSPTSGAPPGRFLHSSVYDAAGDRMVIFGGNATTNISGDATANLDDVWILSSATTSSPSWREVTPSTAARPGPTMGQSAVYDQANGRMIVYAGVDTSNTVTRATWILAGLGSTTQQWFAYDTGVPVPPSRTLQAAAYTGSTLNRMIVFGGSEGGGTYANDTWVLHNANGLPTTPVARITIASASTTICSANWVELTATAYDASDQVVSGVVFVWSSSDETIATVDAEGRVTGIRKGTVTIVATDQAGTVKGTITITVTRTTSAPPDAGGGVDSGSPDCTCYCGWPANQVCQQNSDCPPDESVPGTSVPGVCGCPVGC
jgi:hypothetical protein